MKIYAMVNLTTNEIEAVSNSFFEAKRGVLINQTLEEKYGGDKYGLGIGEMNYGDFILVERFDEDED